MRLRQFADGPRTRSLRPSRTRRRTRAGRDSVEVHQTHISVVFVAGEHAYKIKKPVALGFVDYSTAERRHHFCEEEVRLNRRLAPDVYLGVVPVTRRYAARSGWRARARSSTGR